MVPTLYADKRNDNNYEINSHQTSVRNKSYVFMEYQNTLRLYYNIEFNL